MSQTWDLNALCPKAKQLLADVCNTNDGSMFVDADEVDPDVARELEDLGLIELDYASADSKSNEVGIALTDEGRDWLLSLPEGSLDISIGTANR